jgi:predicted PurR-regulated permease PerM
MVKPPPEHGSSPENDPGAVEEDGPGSFLNPRIPDSLRVLGRGAWLAVGIALALAISLLIAGLISSLLIPLVFAAILAGIFVPLVDRLERARVPRGLAAPFVVMVALAVTVGIVWVVIVGVLEAGSDIVNQVAAGVGEAGSAIDASPSEVEEATTLLKDVTGTLVSGLLQGLGSATVLIVGLVTGTFILLYLMKDWALVIRWAGRTMARFLGISKDQASKILMETTLSFRRYALGLTVIGVMNGVVVGASALLLDVPSAGAIGIITFVTSYIPFFGAFFAGAFAVVIALGAEGLTVALIMLVITLLANNTLQNLVEPIAFGRTLNLHPLVVLVVTTGGTLLFGVLGATLAAPLTAVILRAREILRPNAVAAAGADV